MPEDKPKPRKGPSPGYKAPIKYRGPNGETWTGRGKMPLWMVASGKDKEEFAVLYDLPAKSAFMVKDGE